MPDDVLAVRGLGWGGKTRRRKIIGEMRSDDTWHGGDVVDVELLLLNVEDRSCRYFVGYIMYNDSKFSPLPCFSRRYVIQPFRHFIGAGETFILSISFIFDLLRFLLKRRKGCFFFFSIRDGIDLIHLPFLSSTRKIEPDRYRRKKLHYNHLCSTRGGKKGNSIPGRSQSSRMVLLPLCIDCCIPVVKHTVARRKGNKIIPTCNVRTKKKKRPPFPRPMLSQTMSLSAHPPSTQNPKGN